MAKIRGFYALRRRYAGSACFKSALFFSRVELGWSVGVRRGWFFALCVIRHSKHTAFRLSFKKFFFLAIEFGSFFPCSTSGVKRRSGPTPL